MPVLFDTVADALPASLRLNLKRVIYELRNRRFQPYIKKKYVEGVAFDFWIGDADGRDWYDLKCTDPVWLEMRFIMDHMIEPGDVVLECGAHHGCTTILLSNWVGKNGKVVAFEPLPKNCNIIKKNIELNGINNIILETKAVGARKGQCNISEVSNSFILMLNQGIKVEVINLDEYEHLNPTFIKIDVEGFEHQVLQGSKKILSNNPKLSIEIHPKMLSSYGNTVKDVLELINSDIYKLWIQWNDCEEPEQYDKNVPITKRVHLFCIPKSFEIPQDIY